MVVRVERELFVPAPPEAVWEFIADPEKRARPLRAVADFEDLGDGRAVWHLELPIPLVNRTIRVETREVARDPPRFVEFEGRSKVMTVFGEHELEPVDGGTRLRNQFEVEGSVPGVERYFERTFEGELDALERALAAHLDITLEGES